MNKHFRLTAIHLDDDEEAERVTAAVSPATHDVLTPMLGFDTRSPAVAVNGDSRTIALTIAQARDLFGQTGKINGLDPRHEVTTEVYDSLTAVFYGLMGE